MATPAPPRIYTPLTDATAVLPEPVAGPVVPKPAPGRIEIVLRSGVRVRIEGAVDPAAVTAAIAAVLKTRRRPTPRGKPRGDPER